MKRSARGLFRATGKVARQEVERERDDFYPTPPGPTRAFLRAEGGVLRECERVWEPAAGAGAMAREIEAFGLPVAKSDLIDRGCGAHIASFYDFGAPLAPAVVTNPPFCECAKGKWITHALQVCKVPYMALLLPWGWPSAAGRAALWADHTPARVYLMRWRIDWTGGGASPMLNAWFVWDIRHSGPAELRMLDKFDGREWGEVG